MYRVITVFEKNGDGYSYACPLPCASDRDFDSSEELYDWLGKTYGDVVDTATEYERGLSHDYFWFNYYYKYYYKKGGNLRLEEVRLLIKEIDS